MVSCFISRLVILIFGTLYPAYASYKAVRTKNVKEYVKWMMYWIVFALFTCAETFTDLFLSFWFPFYYEIKIITVIYLLSPATKGSSILYRKFVHPVLIKREQEIDEYIARAKEQGYHTMLNLGSKGVTYATSLIMQTAIKGGGGIVSQLRRSYSLGDISEDNHLRSRDRESEDNVDSRFEDPRVNRRLAGPSPRRTISNASDAGLYFPEVDTFQRPLAPGEEFYYSQTPSLEEISSGYSSGDPMYYAAQRPKGDHLVRTASLGPSSRVRTRATTKAGLPKRSSLSEEGSTWSAMEQHESQIESEGFYNVSHSHSSPFLFPFPPFSNLMRPEYQHIFAQNQTFAFLNPSQYTPPANFGTSKTESPKSPSVIISEIKSEDECIDQNEKETNREDKKVDNENSEANENLVDETSEDSKCERSGRYNKKPAPTPPTDQTIQIVENDDDLVFSTPNSSPKLERKVIEPVVSPPNEEIERKKDVAKSDNLLEVPKKKSKGKKGDKISKKLHLPKMPFSFWHQKGGKVSSGSETSSVASIEISGSKQEDKTDLEYFIPLKDTDQKESKETS